MRSTPAEAPLSKAAASPSQGHDLSETDLYLWAQDQAALLRAKRRQDIDWHHLAEEMQRLQIEGLLDVGPSLRAWPETVLSKACHLGRVRAADESGLAEQTFPPACPYTLAQVLDDSVYPGALEPRFT
ncbi:hypothetical protein ASF58_15395 [Methylobacterium sp. Leaf125]|uniref:DUF29 domain-containing protein n=1 Tax=Methylobacterium sp. Leaf125 TaxID=1736265 RepID=UPI0006FDD9A4|nr:DUF29 domain-containing protein [Methylobacterium sp. Leaf125]KQQ24839.1 hypothetical protein ASF58_15395 [Methylobacterium sp. Leaf125]